MPPSGGGTEIKMRDEKMIKELMHRVFVRTTNMDFSWNWGGGVAFYGIVRAWEVTGDDEYIEYLKGWVDNYLEEGLPEFTINTIALGYTVLALYKYTGDEKYMDIAKSQAEFLTNKTIRFGDGVYQHTVSEKNYNFDEQAWADTLFMAGLFMAKIGALLGNRQYFDDGMNQFHWHIEYLQNIKNGLFYHGWDNVNKNNMSAIHWCRANGWAAITMAEAMHLSDAFNPVFVEMMDALRDQMAALSRLQDAGGMWHTIVDDDSSYCETSGSCAIATAMIKFCVYGGHMLYKKNILRAADAIIAEIGDTGIVMNVSGGTAVMHDEDGYKKIPHTRIQGWGQGLALAFLAELMLFDEKIGHTEAAPEKKPKGGKE